MAKPSPVMQFSKKAGKTAEQIAIEDFMNSIPPEVVVEGDTIIDNTIPETIVSEDTSLDPIVDSAIVADSLDELAGDVDGITSAAAMESYKRIFTQMLDLTGHPIASLENFPATKGGVRKFSKTIRSHAADIRSCVGIALEDYVDKVDETIGSSMSSYKQALGELSKVNEDSINVDGNVTINHKIVWKLFHMNGELMDLKDFQVEVDGVKELAGLVTKGKERVLQWIKGGDASGAALEGKTFVQLMNNTDVTVKDGRAKFDAKEAPKPDRSWSAADWFWIFVFNWMGVVYRVIKGGNGDEQTKKEQSLKAISKVIGEMKKMAPVAQQIEKDAKEIISAISRAPADKQAALKRAASPVLELASKTVGHITEVTYGAMKMFNQASNGGN